MATTNIGIVLSGGGARGAAHIGILQALNENEIFPNVISGSSAGAIVGAMYAAGYPADKILDFYASNSSVFHWKNFSLKKMGLLDTEKFTDILEPWLGQKRFEDLDYQLHVCAVDLQGGYPKYIRSGELIRPILASAAVPGVFSPVELDGVLFVDGSTMDNFPVFPLKKHCDFIIGSYVSTPFRSVSRTELNSTIQVVNRSADLALLGSSMDTFSQTDYMFIPDELYQFGTFDSKKVRQIYEMGYDFALRKMEDFLTLFHKTNSSAQT